MKQLYSLLFTLIVTSIVMGQADSSRKHPFFKINAVGLRVGGGMIERTDLNQSDFQKVAPNNTLVNSDLSNLKKTINEEREIWDIGILMSLKPSANKNKLFNERFEYHVSLSYQVAGSNKLMYSHTDTIPLDTFSSQTTGVIFKTDSFNTTDYSFHYNTENIALDVSCLYDLIHKKVFKFYTGISVGIGYTINNTVIALYNDGNYTSDKYSRWGKRRFRYEKEEMTELKNTVLFQFSVPVGITLKFHRRSRFSLNPEVRVGDRIEKLPGLTYTHSPYFLFNFGLKYNFKK